MNFINPCTMPLWDGRFEGEMDERVRQFSASLPFDQRLARYDVQGSIAHAQMLGKCGIIPAEEAEQIVTRLQALLAAIELGTLSLDTDDEDIHSLIERVLTESLGPVGGKLHTARSRNDQVALDVRMFAKDAIRDLQQRVRALQQTLLQRAEEHLDAVMPGFTHTQPAQPVLLSHHLLAYFWMLQRDAERLQDCFERTDVMPLGSAALAGTSFPLDREFVAAQLGFSRVSENSLDAVSDRDFVMELVFCCTTIMLHLSRLCEELVWWSNPALGFVEFDDRYATGSSIMPQKKNPDVAELVRGKSGRVAGDLTALVTMMKGLPLTYNRDMQEDKEPLFDAVDTTAMSLSVLNGAVATLTFNVERMRAAAAARFSLATDLADYLTKKGLPFREAHRVVGRLVRDCLARHRTLEEMSVEDFQQFHPLFAADVVALLSVDVSVAARNVVGGTAPESVRQQLEKAKRLVEATSS
ncbi:MAG: argininosuccinate lyase [Abditibacteriales bacterium]|nr:argininosuccinate lyase [Abditibacteriales bacterium]MDW8364722.1 argininosuccinate lyase [Abditibacteriales bacterium]